VDKLSAALYGFCLINKRLDNKKQQVIDLAQYNNTSIADQVG
jgi:hypothetical protein